MAKRCTPEAYAQVQTLRAKYAEQHQLFEELQASMAAPLMQILSTQRDSEQLRRAFREALPEPARTHAGRQRERVPEMFERLKHASGAVQLDVCMALLPFLLPTELERE